MKQSSKNWRPILFVILVIVALAVAAMLFDVITPDAPNGCGLGGYGFCGDG